VNKERRVSGTPPWEPEDADRTVIRPAPGGRHSATKPDGPASAAARRANPSAAGPENPDSEAPAIIGSPLLKAATPLLRLLGRLSGTTRQPDVHTLRERVGGEISAFEKRCRTAGISMELVRPAHYALCAAIDDVVLHTPWGASSAWNTRPLAASLYRGLHSEDQFFDILTQLRQEPEKFLPVLELMYLCLSLGFMGRYRDSQHDPGGLDRLRDEICALIVQQRGSSDRLLSPHWQGVASAYRNRLGTFPVWVPLVAAAAIIGALWVWVSHDLNAESDGIYERISAIPPTQMPGIVRPVIARPLSPSPDALVSNVTNRLKEVLKDTIAGQLVSVQGTASAPVIRIGSRGMFQPGGADVSPAFVSLLERIGAVLKSEPGLVQVIGHTDNVPLRSVPFPSNFQLSLARARSVRAIMLHTFTDPARISAEGRGDADPIMSNATADGREQNRRIEIVLHRRD
jgi:type VI secretion system protein ImpK